MGRPLRAKYANTTYVDGVQEMSNTDISSRIVPLISQYLVDNYANASSVGLGQTLLIQPSYPFWGSNVSPRGYFYDTRAVTSIGVSGVVGDHPTTNTSQTYILFQNINDSFPYGAAPDLGANRPVQTTTSGGVRRIQSMTDTEIRNDIISNVISTMVTGGQGAYWLGTSAPVDGGTWVVRSTVTDTYNGVSGNITTNYYLWQKTSAGTVGTVRPLKRSANNQLQEMTDAEIVALAPHVLRYIFNTGISEGIGTYIISTTAPGTGTWISRGSFTDTRNILVDTSYEGSYLSDPGFTGFFTGGYSGAYTSSYIQFTGFAGSYERFFTGTYEGSYSKVGVFSGSLTYTGASFTGVFSGATSSLWTKSFSNEFTASYSGSYSRLFTGTYEGSYNRTFQGLYNNSFSRFFSGIYQGTYTTLFSGIYQGTYTSTWAGSYAGGYQNPFNAVYYTGLYAGTRDKNYTGVYGSYTGLAVVGGQVQPIAYVAPNSQGTGFTTTYGSVNITWGVAYTRSFTGTYGGYTGAGNIAYSTVNSGTQYTGSLGSFTGFVYTQAFTATYTGDWTRAFAGFYQGGYASPSYAGTYLNFFGRVFTGVYGSYTGAGNIAYSSPPTAGTPVYTRGFTGNYTGVYSSTYVGPDPGGTYTGLYNNQVPFTRLFTGVYSGLTVSSSTVTTTYTLWVRTA